MSAERIPGPGGDGTFVKSAQPPALQIERRAGPRDPAMGQGDLVRVRER